MPIESALICIISHCHVGDDDLCLLGRHGLFSYIHHLAEINFVAESALICIPSHCHVVDDDLYFVGRHDLFVVVSHKAEFNCRPFDSYFCVMFQDTCKLLSRFIVD